MRRWFALLLICLLPLQASWAGLANYCLHEQGAAVQHFGHHIEEHQLAGEAADHDTPAGHSQHHDHLASFLGLTSEPLPLHSPRAQSAVAGDDPGFPSLPPDQPERPNWRHPA